MKATKNGMRILAGRSLWLMAWLLGLATSVRAEGAAASAPWQADFANEPLYRALKAVELHFHHTVLFVYDEVQPYRVTMSLKADNAEEAVTQLLIDKPFFFKSGRDFISVSKYDDRPVEACVLGRVMDRENAPLPHAYVELFRGEGDGRVAAVAADESGYFSIGTQALSSFTLRVSYMGYKPYTLYLQNVHYDLDLGRVVLRDTVMPLRGVQVYGESVRYRPDRILISPTPEQRAGTLNSMDLLEHLVLPGGACAVSSSLLSEQHIARMDIRINGRKASYYQLRALRSDDVVYVEYLYGTGGGRHNGVSAINLVTRKETTLTAGAELSAALPWADNRLAVYGRRQTEDREWHLAYDMRQSRQNGLRHDEESRSPQEEAEGAQPWTARTTEGRRAFEQHRLEGGGRMRFGEADELQVQAQMRFRHEPENYVTRCLGHNGSEAPGTDRAVWNGRQAEPVLELTYGHSWADAARLKAGFTGRLQAGSDDYRYEALRPADEPFAGAYHRRERLWEGLWEAGYEKNWKAHRIASELKHRQQLASLRVDGTAPGQSVLRTAESRLAVGYGYKDERWQAQLKGALHRLFLGTPEGGRTRWLGAPEATLGYRPGQGMRLHYALAMTPRLPDVRQTAPFRLLLDARHSLAGRSDLRPAADWQQTLGLDLQKGGTALQLGVNHRYVRHPLASVTSPSAAEGEWCYRMENGTAATDWSPVVSLSARLRGTWLQLAGRYAFHRLAYRSVACRSALNYSHWEVRLFGYGKGWDYGLTWGSAERLLLGDAEIRLPDTNKIYVSRQLKQFRLGIDWLHPFCCSGDERREMRFGGGEKRRQTETLRGLRHQINLTLSWTLSREKASE